MGCKPLDKLRKKHKKGLWSPDEDQKLRNYILMHGVGCWSSVPINAGLQRNGKSCRLRWINYLRPGLKQGPFSVKEEETILRLHGILGNKWAQIAQHLPGRTDNEIKNYWHSYLKKNIANMGEIETQTKDECKDPIIGEEESSQSSLKTTPQTSSFTSFENIEGSLTDTDQSFSKMEFPREAGTSSFPKILFSEWLSQDRVEFLGNSGNPLVPKNTIDQQSSNLQDPLMQDLLLNEGMLCGNIHQGLYDSSVAGMYRPPLKFEDQMLETGLFEFNQGENIITDVFHI